jgi:DNA-binding transcriptional regulator YiaG
MADGTSAVDHSYLSASRLLHTVSASHNEEGCPAMSLVTGAQLRAARALAGVEQEQLAAAAGVGVNTISKLEQHRGEFDGARVGTIRRLQRALEAAGVAFTNGGEPGVKMRRATP